MLSRIADALMPVRVDGNDVPARSVAFADDDGDAVYLALLVGDWDTEASEPLLTRVHSGCLTGDVLASQRCDCGDQLTYSMSVIATAGRGLVIYAPTHEGRGIGLVNKIRAYGLQDSGLDTVDANLALGLEVDGRQFSDVATALAMLGVDDIELLTNNPMKVEALQSSGLTVTRRGMPLFETRFNARYLATKRARLGHFGVERQGDRTSATAT